MDSSRNQPADDCESVSACANGLEVYGEHGLLASSVDLGWSGLSAELRTHTGGVLTWKSTKPETEVCVAIRANNLPVTRVGGGVVDRAIARQGTVWLCPPEEHLVDLRALENMRSPKPQILHMYLPARYFSAEGLGISLGHSAPGSLRYQRSFQDPLVAEIAFAIVSEMRAQTAGGRLLTETLAISLAARLMQRHSGLPLDKDFVRLSNRGLDRRRLTRVKEFIAANLERELTIAQLAEVASLSQFHFARAFKAAVGQSPHQYVSAYRLDHAKELLTRWDHSLLDIAVALNFSSQANFTRAFRKSTGMTPGEFRRRFNRH